MRRPILLVSLLLPIIAAACGPSTPGATARIAFVQDLSAPGAEEHVQPALQAAELAVRTHAPEGVRVELVPVDLTEDPAAVQEVASDPSYVAAIAGPGADGSAFAEAGLPTVSVSTAGPTPALGSWRRFVAPMDVLADVLAGQLGGTARCVLSEEPPPDALAGLLSDRLGVPVDTVDPAESSGGVVAGACDGIAWAGSAEPGAELARGLGDGVALVGGDRLLDPDFVGAGSWTDGAQAACACTDMLTSLDPPAMRFIQDYQAEFGTAPGAYAVESWDATRALLATLGGGADRADVGAALEGLEAFAGLGSTYRFDPSGEREDPVEGVSVSELRSGRWVPLPG